ncbi:hypothetical protein H0H93_007043 [Arthromyces matolae]|nr:hypothetical protein H0H93_007043 [Arthromyces matolae]
MNRIPGLILQQTAGNDREDWINIKRKTSSMSRSLSLPWILLISPTKKKRRATLRFKDQQQMASDSPFHTLIPLNTTLGAAFLGNIVAGVHSDRDRLWFKGVASVYVTNISETIVRCIFGRRVWLSMFNIPLSKALSEDHKLVTEKSILMVFLIALTSMGAFVLSMIFTTRMYLWGSLVYLPKVAYSVYTGIASGVAADSLIAATLCVSLWRRLLTSFCLLACLISLVAWPGQFIFIAIYFSVNELFLNSLLATLNNRETLSKRNNGVIGISSNLNAHNATQSMSKPTPKQHSQVVVNINREVVANYELEDV